MATCCPICYKIGLKTPELLGEYCEPFKREELVQQRFFKFFPRYLNEGNGTEDANIDKRRTPLHENSQLEKLAEVGMLPCTDCLSQMEAFCDLYNKLKATELLLNWKVWTLKNIMTGAQRVSSRVQSFREFIENVETDAGEGGNYCGSRNWNEIINSIVKSRKALIGKCSRRMANVTPTLSISRWEPDDQNASTRCPMEGVEFVNDNSKSVTQSTSDVEQARADNIGKEIVESPKPSSMSPSHSNAPNEEHNAGPEDSSFIDMDHGDPYPNGEGFDGPQNFENNFNETATKESAEASEESPYFDRDRDHFSSFMKIEADLSEFVGESATSSNVYTDNAPSAYTESDEGKHRPLPPLEPMLCLNTNFAIGDGPPQLDSSVDVGNTYEGMDRAENTLPLEPKVITETIPTNNKDLMTCDEIQNSETRTGLRPSHKCPKCGKSFSTGERLLSHKQEAHADDDLESLISEDEQGHIDSDMKEVSPPLSSSSSSPSSDDYDDDMDFLSGTEEEILESKIGIRSQSQFSDSTDPSPQAILEDSSIKGKIPKHPPFRLRCPDCTTLFKDVRGILIHRKFSSTCGASYDPKFKINVDVLVSPSNSQSSTTTQYDGDDVSNFSIVFAKIALPQEIFLCEKCDLAVYSSEDMEAHNRLHGSFHCKFCNAEEDYAPNLSIHERKHAKTDGKKTHANGNRPIFYCARCDYRADLRQNYIAHHLKTHLGLVVNKPKCAICKTSSDYVRNIGLATHFITHHDLTGISGSKGLHTCPRQNCRAYYLLKWQLKNHMEIRHNGNINLRIRRAKTTTSQREIIRATPPRNKPGSGTLDEFKSDSQQQTLDCSEPVEDKILEDNPSSASNVIKIAVTATCPKIKDNKILGRHFRLKCPDCNFLFKDVKSLLTHRRDSQSCTGTYDRDASIKVEVVVPSPGTKQKETTTSFGIDDKHFSNLFAIIDIPQRMFKCEDCKILLYSSESLERHKSLHGKFNCNFCQMELTCAKKLAIHELQHSRKAGKLAKHVNCPRCGVSTAHDKHDYQYVPHYLSQHMSLKWQGEPLCAICKTTSTKQSLRKADLGGHFKTYHDLSHIADLGDVVRCEMGGCDAYFLTRAQLTIHIKHHHKIRREQRRTDKDIKLSCKDCDKSFVQHRSLDNHRIKHHVPLDKIIPCPFQKCNLVYETRQLLELHLALFKERHKAFDEPKDKKFVNCPVCHKRICGKSSSFLKTHMKSHDTSHVCEQCGKQFKDRGILEIHQLSHSGPESWKYSCSICGKKCLDKHKLNEHMRTHTKETPYVCEICGQKYAHRHNLRIHVNNKHGDEVQDIPRMINKKNFTSKKGIKRKEMEFESQPEDVSRNVDGGHDQ